jgi:hypothetical protein
MCGSAEVRSARNGVAFGSSERVGLRPHLEPGFRGAVRLHQSDLWTFACVTCGHIEMYLLDPAALEYIETNWLPVPSQ